MSIIDGTHIRTKIDGEPIKYETCSTVHDKGIEIDCLSDDTREYKEWLKCVDNMRGYEIEIDGNYYIYGLTSVSAYFPHNDVISFTLRFGDCPPKVEINYRYIESIIKKIINEQSKSKKDRSRL